MNKKWFSWLFVALLPAAMAVPQSALADPTCVGSECEVVFNYTGSEQIFTPPAGATNFRFEVFGAAGGRGGAGGKITGNLTQVPQTIRIYVGGVGKMGSGISGGFNGGGGSGGNSGTEGAGGGASDLRLDSNLNSRIIVAGGGGGGGGEAGGSGGHGGDLYGGNGVSGQASGGGGGTPDRGGFSGASNGGFSQATAGSFGLGGRGGFSTFAGGGGGGGGWYGGGGGGSDDNTCCSDGGGGGGGSSYADTQYTSNISHQAGTNWGDGKVILRFTQPPAITSFTLTQQSGTIANFSLQANSNLTGLSAADFTILGEGCELSELVVSGQSASGKLVGCLNGEVQLTLKANTFGEGATGPALPLTATLLFDADPPTFSFTTETFRSAGSDQNIELEVSDDLALNSEMFSVVGCSGIEVQSGSLSLSDCTEGPGSVTLKAQSLSDSWQNLGPESDIILSFEIDQTAPTASWSEITFTGTEVFQYRATLTFSEPVVVSEDALTFESSVQCESSFEVLATTIEVLATCSHAELSWTFMPGANDSVGNQMAVEPLVIALSNLLPEPEPEPEPEPQPEEVIGGEGSGGGNDSGDSATTPATESPAQQPVTEPAPVSNPEPEVVSDPEPSVEVVPEPLPTQEQPAVLPLPISSSEQPAANPPMVVITEAADSGVGSSQAEPEAMETEPEPTPTSAAEPVQDLLVAEPVAGAALELNESSGLPWLPIALLLLVAAMGFGVWRFSGR